MYNSYQLVKILEELLCSITKAVRNEHNDEITPQQRLKHTSIILVVVLHGCQTWSLTYQRLSVLRTGQWKALLWALYLLGSWRQLYSMVPTKVSYPSFLCEEGETAVSETSLAECCILSDNGQSPTAVSQQ